MIARARRWLFLGLLALYSLTSGGHFYSPDEWSHYTVTANLVERGEVSVDARQAIGPLFERAALDGKLYSKYGLMQPLVQTPFYLAGRLLAAASGLDRTFATVLAVSFTGALLTAASAVAFFELARGLFGSARLALGLSLAYGLGTMAWGYAKTTYSEPLLALLLLLLLLALRRLRETGAPSAAFEAGILFGVALWTRPAAALWLPALGGYVLFALLRGFAVASSGREPNPPTPFPRPEGTREGGVIDDGDSPREGGVMDDANSAREGRAIDDADSARAGGAMDDGGSARAGEAMDDGGSAREGGAIVDDGPPFPRREGGRGVRFSAEERGSRPRWIAQPLLAFAVPIAVAAVALAGYNLARFGGLLETGYTADQLQTRYPLLLGLAILLFSPAKSYFLFCPLALLALLGARAFVRRWPAEAALAAALVLPQVLFYATLNPLASSWAPGPRYHLPLVALTLLPVGALFATLPAGAGRRWAWWAFGLLVFVGAVVQVLVVSTDPSAGLEAVFRAFERQLPADFLYADPNHSLIAWQARFSYSALVRTLTGQSPMFGPGSPFPELQTAFPTDSFDFWWINMAARTPHLTPVVAAIGGVLALAAVVGIWRAWRSIERSPSQIAAVSHESAMGVR